MKVVIDIPESAYNVCYDLREVGGKNCLADILVNAVGIGTPLPKGHGRLIDADKLTTDDLMFKIDTWDGILKIVENNAPTVLKADNETKAH